MKDRIEVTKTQRVTRPVFYADSVSKLPAESGDQINKLTVVLFERNRTGDLLWAAKDKEYQKQLLEEYNL